MDDAKKAFEESFRREVAKGDQPKFLAPVLSFSAPHPALATSPGWVKLAEHLLAVQKVVENATKNAANPHLKNKYADLGAVLDAVKGPLNDNGFVILQHPATGGEKGTVTVATTLLHTSGEWLAASVSMPLTKSDPQGVGSAITYARRYLLSALLSLTAEDDDGNAASGVGGRKQAATSSKRSLREALPPANPTREVARLGVDYGWSLEELKAVEANYRAKNPGQSDAEVHAGMLGLMRDHRDRVQAFLDARKN